MVNLVAMYFTILQIVQFWSKNETLTNMYLHLDLCIF